MKLRVKDLQHFLAKRRINIKACVEKKDLVELVLQHSGATSPVPDTPGAEARVPPTGPSAHSPNSWEDASIRVSDQVPLERSGNFPQSYVDSSHRRDWFQEKFGPNSESTTPSDTGADTGEAGATSRGENTPVEAFNVDTEDKIEVTNVEAVTQSDEEDDTSKIEDTANVEPILTPEHGITDSSEDAHMLDADEVMSVEVEEIVSAASDTIVQDKDEEMLVELTAAKETPEVPDTTEEEEVSSEGAVGGLVENNSATQAVGAKLNIPLLGDQETTSTPSSPRRFANQGMVYLSEIESLEDLRELSTKQVKELLAMNRVNFKGCVEKEELLKIVERLWRQEQRNKEEGDAMDDDSMCKICMDSPIDCVMLECGHMCTCTNCGKQMAECPICRQYVVRVVKTFKA